MTNNLNLFGGQGLRYVFWALWDSADPDFISGTDGSLTSGEDSGAGRAQGINDLTIAVPEATIIDRPGDNSNLGSFIANPSSGPSGNDVYISFDQLFDVAATTRAIKAEGPHDISLSSNSCFVFTPIFIVVNSPAMSDESGSIGEDGWAVEEYLYTFVQPQSVAAKALNTPHNYTHKLIFNERGTLHYGETITEANYGVTKAWKTDPYWSPYPIFYHVYVGDGQATQTFTLDKVPVADDGDALQIWDEGAKLTHTTNYAVNTTTGLVTFVDTTPGDGDFAVCKVMFAPDC